jgi:hypothetical protein
MFRKKEKLKLTAYAPSTGLIDLFPVVKSQMPSWFKKLGKNDLKSDKPLNAKVCTGLLDLYADSITIPAWQDMSITIFPNGETSVEVQNEKWGVVVFTHQLDTQAPGVWPNHVAVKFVSPWLMECNKDIKWHSIQPTWDQTSPCDYVIIPGTFEFKYYNRSNLFALFPIKENPVTYNIRAGEPLAMLLPGTEEEYELSCEFISHDDAERILTKIWEFKPGLAYQRFRSYLRKKNANIDT